MEKRLSDADGHPALNLSNPPAVSSSLAGPSNGVASKIQMFGACISDAPVRTLERTLSNSKRQAQHEEFLRLLLGCQVNESKLQSIRSRLLCSWNTILQFWQLGFSLDGSDQSPLRVCDHPGAKQLVARLIEMKPDEVCWRRGCRSNESAAWSDKVQRLCVHARCSRDRCELCHRIDDNV